MARKVLTLEDLQRYNAKIAEKYATAGQAASHIADTGIHLTDAQKTRIANAVQSGDFIQLSNRLPYRATQRTNVLADAMDYYGYPHESNKNRHFVFKITAKFSDGDVTVSLHQIKYGTPLSVTTSYFNANYDKHPANNYNEWGTVNYNLSGSSLVFMDVELLAISDSANDLKRFWYPKFGAGLSVATDGTVSIDPASLTTAQVTDLKSKLGIS